MKTQGFKALLALLVILSACGKKDSGVGPGGTVITPETGIYNFIPHGVALTLPSSVNVFFNVTDTAGTPVSNLTVDRFAVSENGTEVSHATSAMTVLKRSKMNYRFKTALLIDASSGSPLEAVKTAARAFIALIDPQQSIAIYRFSDKTELAQDFTHDAGALNAAVDALAAGPASRNLFDAVKDGVALFEEYYFPASAQQTQIVVFTSGNDSENNAGKKAETVYTAGFGSVYTIGLGADLDTDFLRRTGNKGFILVSDSNGLSEAFAKTEASITAYADGYYRLVYASTLRGDLEQSLQLSVNGNTYAGSGSVMATTFNSRNFINVPKGIYVDWTPSMPKGVDTLIVGSAVSRKAVALSLGGEKFPMYRWSTPDPQVLRIESSGEGAGEAVLTALAEGFTSLVVADEANSITDTVVIRAVQAYNGYALREWWENITGANVADLTGNSDYPGNPKGRTYITKLETQINWKDNYGQRLRGYVVPPADGSYSFWIASDDASQLFLSTDDNPSNKQLIARVSAWTNSREYTKETNQHSGLIPLEAGKMYFFEVLHKEGGGGDDLSVAWDGPGIARTEIGGAALSAWLGN
jgi:hypothetical protein